MPFKSFIALATLLAAASLIRAAEWPEYHGPTHDGVSTEKLSPWTTEPRVLWKIKMGEGFGSYAIVGGKAYLYCEDAGQEKCVALDSATGKPAWTFSVDKTIHEGQGGNGPRSTPAVYDDRVYVMSTYLKLVCLDAKSGKPVWGHDLNTEYAGQSSTSGIKQWGSAESPVVDDGLVFCVGGGPGKALMAFDAKTGRVAWAHGNDKLTHATPTVATLHGVKQIIFFTQSGLVSCETKSGKELWRYPFDFKTATAASPVVFEDIVYCSAAYGVGGGACKVSKTGDQFSAAEIWRTKGDNMNHWTSCVCKDGYLYGMFGWNKQKTEPLKCVDIRTGKTMWSQDGFGQGGLQLVGDHLVVQGDQGQLVLVEATSKSYNELSRTQLLSGKAWNSPVVSDGKLYARTTTEAICLDLTAK